MDIDAEDLENMPDGDLRELVRRAQQVLGRRVAERREETLKKIQQMAAEVGLTVHITDMPKTGEADVGKREKRKAPSTASSGGEASARKIAPKYRNPENPAETWAGRGRKPKWVEDALAKGRTLSDLAIRE